MSHRPEPAGRKGKDLWAGLNPALYRGRGQTSAKHVLLKQYFQDLAFKVLQSPKAPTDFLYLDGFSGPWQSQGESFEDTSFSIVLTMLTDVREALAAKGRFPQIRAVFVEEGDCILLVRRSTATWSSRFRPDLSFLREVRLGLDPAVEATPALAPLIDPNLHSCGTATGQAWPPPHWQA